jgi:hypothetical protein
MKMFLVLWAALLAGGNLCAQSKSSPEAAPSRAASGKAEVSPVALKAEPFLLLPEPREMRVAHSMVLGGAKHTVFTPVRRVAGKPGLVAYSKEEFSRLGISPDTFEEKSREAADRILATLQPEFIKDDAGRVRYAVYRGDDTIFACLLVAPSLAKVFEKVFGKESWAAVPDRHALYVFPPNPTIVDDFAADLQARFEAEAFAASEEVFRIRSEAGEMRAVGTFRER